MFRFSFRQSSFVFRDVYGSVSVSYRSNPSIHLSAGHTGTLSAPVGDEVVVAELRAQGSAVLAAWNWEVFENSLGLMAACCRDMALLHGVTLAHDGGPRAQRSTGVVVVGVGTDAAALVAWTLECQAAGLELPWWVSASRELYYFLPA